MKNYLVIYHPWGTGLPNNQRLDVPAMTLLSSERVGDTLVVHKILPGGNIFPKSISKPVKVWLKSLKDAGTVEIRETNSDQMLAKSLEPNNATEILRGLCGGIDVFMTDCTNPAIAKAAKQRKDMLAQLGGQDA